MKKLHAVCSDLEGVWVPEVWINVAERTGIPELRLTTRDIKDYDELMFHRLQILKEKNLTLLDIQRVIATIRPLHGAPEMINWLNERNIEFVEQPMPKDQIDDIAWLTQNSPLPIIGDESIQRIPDVIKAHGVYSGINIKLMKCTGMREANKMLSLARSLDMKVMIGCMTETSCAISAAAQLSPMMDWADLDGALLIKNDPYEGIKVIDGKVTLTDYPGIGLKS